MWPVETTADDPGLRPRRRALLDRDPLVLVLVLVLVLATGLAAALARLVPPGQPYDEPAHWSNVLYIAVHRSLPVLGDPGVGYEAQMGPLYYVPSAVAVVLVGGVGDPHTGFLTLRYGWIVLVPLLGLLTHRLARGWGLGRLGSSVAMALVVLNPTLLAIGSSIQNDYLCITLATAGSLVVLRALRDPASGALGFAGAGALIGLAVLTKVFAVGLLAGALVALALDAGRPMRARLTAALSVTAAFAAVTGWWFVRNLILYGDLTGAAGVDRAGYSFPPLRLDGPSSVAAWLQTLVSYVFVPTEYYRNAFEAPLLLRGAAVLLTGAVVVLVGAHLVHRRAALWPMLRERPDRTYVWTSLVVTCIGYAVAAWTIQGIAPRLTFVVAPLASVVVVAAGLAGPRPLRGAVALSVLLTTFAATDVWLAFTVFGVDTTFPPITD